MSMKEETTERDKRCAQSQSDQSPEDEDRISRLPTELLVHILSFLNLKEAARTGVVSKCWLGLWTLADVPLDFDGRRRRINIPRNPIPPLVEWVNKVVRSYQATAIDVFRICFELDKYSQADIDEWLEYAFGRRVLSLELNFLRDGLAYYHIAGAYRFPCIRIIDDEEEESVKVSAETVDLLINRFHSLEHLALYNSWSRDLSSLLVCGSSSLKSLELIACESLNSIILRDTCLVSLKFDRLEFLVLENFPLLVDVWAVGWKLDLIIPQLTALQSSLEVLTLGHSYFSVTARQSSPNLEKFVLKWKWDEYSRSKRKFEKVSGLPLRRLKVVEIHGYTGRRADDEVVMYIVENSSSALQRLVLDPHCRPMDFFPLRGKHAMVNMAKIRAEKLSKGIRARKLLDQGLPTSSVELVIL
ncbi:OLC1v1010815C1 [Oldenlandia corymbosa var. corymbosa]|uniref:OLC1v1010815C1 n=1 Tax=Oldenlandia corymbosa var. corymbosa TaxID=529605 RepID=A0AAV1DS89_OLDCO|nr:OLC1v1010815C1 [Oldenlandia corymbosa var. corymbosa]